MEKPVVSSRIVGCFLRPLAFHYFFLSSYLISDLRWHTHKIRSPSLGQVMFKSSQTRPCWAVEALPLRRWEF